MADPCSMLTEAMRDELEAQGFYSELVAALESRGEHQTAERVRRIAGDERGHAEEYLKMARAVGCDVPSSVASRIRSETE